MSGVAVVNYLLSHSASVTALVNAANIVSGNVPLGQTLPAISVRQISSLDTLDVPMTGKRLATDRVQITAIAKDYATKKAVLAAARAAVVGQKGTVNGVSVDSILPDIEGPDLDDPGAMIFEQSRDVIVKWHRAA